LNNQILKHIVLSISTFVCYIFSLWFAMLHANGELSSERQGSHRDWLVAREIGSRKGDEDRERHWVGGQGK
jgi:hypothetical protein